MRYTDNCSAEIDRLRTAICTSDAIVIGAGAGLSASAGQTYSGERFLRYFSDFHDKYGIEDMYSGGFYPFETLEEYWAWWSRHIFYNRYAEMPGKVFYDLKKLIDGHEYFVITTNVDHQFQLAGFDKRRLFYTQGDYGLWQCSRPCHKKTYDNETAVRRMVLRQKDMKIPTELVPICPQCGAPMTMNLRSDDKFVEDEGWHAAAGRYTDFLREHAKGKVLFLELGVGYNTPGIIKYPFWQMTYQNQNAIYAAINREAETAREISDRSICISGDISEIIEKIQ